MIKADANLVLLGVLALAIFAGAANINKSKVVIAINCGSSVPLTSTYGFTYERDKYYRGGVEGTTRVEDRYLWLDSPDLDVYFNERYSNTASLVYEIPLKKGEENGHYVLILKFSETHFEESGKKVFDVALGSKTIIKDIDVFKRVGRFVPYDEYLEFDVKNKQLYFNNTVIPDAFLPAKLAFVLKLVKGKDNPKINAIIVVKGALAGN